MTNGNGIGRSDSEYEMVDVFDYDDLKGHDDHQDVGVYHHGLDFRTPAGKANFDAAKRMTRKVIKAVPGGSYLLGNRLQKSGVQEINATSPGA